MAVKYHVSLCSRPQDLLLVTLNHIDGLRAMVPRQAQVISTLDSLYDNIMEVCSACYTDRYYFYAASFGQSISNFYLSFAKIENFKTRIVQW